LCQFSLLFLRLLLLKSNEEVVEGVINSVSQGTFQIVATATEALDTADFRLRTCKAKTMQIVIQSSPTQVLVAKLHAMI